MKSTTFEDIDAAIQSKAPDLIELRRYLHERPELSLHEFETTDYLAKKLKALGFVVHIRPEKVGFYADLIPDNFDPKTQKTIAVRCDLDALPIEEKTEHPYISKNPGIMHACGHDAHMSVITGIAEALAAHTLPGRLRLIYQHAEETSPGGSSDMIDFGVLEGVESILGVHVEPKIRAGKIGIKAGAFTAAFDIFEIQIFGKTGHGARPHHCIDPIFVMTQVANALYNVIGRRIDARDPMTFSIGKIEGGSAYNVIPDSAFMGGTIRTLSVENREQIEPLLRQVIAGICQAQGADFELNILRGSPAIINDGPLSRIVRQAAVETIGEENVIDMQLPSMGSEDFSEYLKTVPGAMFRLGVADRDNAPMLHSSLFTIDEKALCIGTRVLTRSVLKLFER